MTFSKSLENFPITSHLDSICNELKRSTSHCLVLTAETGAGKSTILPLGLLNEFEGKILVTQPRRLAVLNVADRISQLLGESCGETCGYKVHLESRISEKTRLEILSEAILVRYLQSDPSLEKYNVVVLDEFHERSINVDLALAFLKEAMELRDDLYVIVMSATIDTQKISYFLGKPNNPAPVVKIQGRTFPVKIEYKGNISVEKAVLSEVEKGFNGNILIFLPGISEIRKCFNILKESLFDYSDIELLMLHSSISLEEQKKVISETSQSKRRIIISSSIAETSITVPGVTCVIDSGLSRLNKIDVSTGMQNLFTQVESVFSAEQRAGRAGRICEGRCLRLWNQSDSRINDLLPEIKRCDLTSLVLECAERGIFDPNGIDFLDNPSKSSWLESVFLLKNIGCLKNDCHISDKGKYALSLPVHPRLSSIVLSAWGKTMLITSGANQNKNNRQSLLSYAESLVIKYGGYNQSLPFLQKKVCQDLEHRLEKCRFIDSLAEYSTLILNGFADRLAHKVYSSGSCGSDGTEKMEYQFPSGRKAVLHSSIKIAPEWIVAPEVVVGTAECVIYSFEEMKGDCFDQWLFEHIDKKKVCSFENGKVHKVEQSCFGQIVLSEKKLIVENNDFAYAWVDEIKNKGFYSLPINEKIKQFLMRVKFYEQQMLEEKQDCENKYNFDSHYVELEERLANCAEEWIVPFFSGIKTLDSKILYESLYWYLDGKKIDTQVPVEIILQNKRKVRVLYEKKEKIRPVIEIIIQRIFGCFNTPSILGMEILFRLLSPASRPLQITDNLESFWLNTWPEICKEMKGKYPKHNWDYKIYIQEK